MVNFTLKDTYDMDDLLAIMKLLRAPGGCPWDLEQTNQSIRHDFIEEVYEACEAIDLRDDTLLTEELGDVLLQVVFHAEIASETDRFQFGDVVDGVCKKLIIRHPHIFGGLRLETGTSDEVLKNWDIVKQETKQQTTYTETLEAVPKSFPALMRAEKVMKRAKKAGMDWRSAGAAMDELSKETEELSEASAGQGDAFRKLGDVLFAAVALARQLGVDPELALNDATDRYTNRFAAVENRCIADGRRMNELEPEALDKLWAEEKDKGTSAIIGILRREP